MAAARSTCALKVCWLPEVSVVKYCISVIVNTKQILRTLMYISYQLSNYWLQAVFDLNRCV